MINEANAKKFCKDDISKIENYDKAIADTTQTWICHHRLGLTLDGEFAHSRDELKQLDMYYQRPYFELQFLTESEHRRLHCKNLSEEARKKISEAHKGKTVSDETRKKMSESQKGRTLCDEHRKKLSEAVKGKTGYWAGKNLSEETKKKISEANKARWAKYRQQKLTKSDNR